MTVFWDKEILVLGCGNVLFGDDGLGPRVIEYLNENFKIPQDVGVINAGLSVREILFNIALADKKPKKIIIVDAVDVGKIPGDIFELEINKIPPIKIDDFSMHQLPTSNLLYELRNICGIDVKVISAQIEHIPEEVEPGLSPALENAIPRLCNFILQEIEYIESCD